MNKNTLFILGGIVVIALIILGISTGFKPKTESPTDLNSPPLTNTTSTTTETKNTGTQKPSVTVTQVPVPTANSGRVVFAVTDAAINLNDIKSVFVTITELKIHSPTKGWITIPFTAKKVDLLEFRRSGSVGYLTEANLARETYDQLSLSVKDANVIKTDTTSVPAKLPSGTIKILIPTKVEKGDTVAVTFDFDVDKSLLATGSGSYIFLPFIKVSTQTNSIVQIRNSGQILIGGGANYISREFGIDENGDSIEGFSLKPNMSIDFIGDILKVKRNDLDETKLTISANKAIEIATNSGFSKILSIELKDKNSGIYWEITGIKKSARTTIYIDPANGSIVQL